VKANFTGERVREQAQSPGEPTTKRGPSFTPDPQGIDENIDAAAAQRFDARSVLMQVASGFLAGPRAG
jgi:hypothetical protein